MRPNILLALLSSTSIATATTFTAFPTTLTCNLASGTATFTTSELESIASAGVKETPFEKSASNTGSGRCQKINLPYYSSDLGKGAGQLYFVYDSKAKNIEFCTADTPSLTGGYPDTCDF
ncbi:hypothetical protein IFR04_013560 [Cadophora malorum]|uniref:AA1-like domain-containing protein n=1 Tax=Cadophora malorum TaxID=108018 RepID=A0A8H7T6D4_9HELO|nr:hypothetical protein IFR04_013560 [Cadophora malorum]